jgi:hypothetical protein
MDIIDHHFLHKHAYDKRDLSTEYESSLLTRLWPNKARSLNKNCRVNWINVIIIFKYLRNVTITFKCGKMPLQLCVYLIDGFTPTHTAYTSQYTVYFQRYVHIDGGVYQIYSIFLAY